MVSLCRAMDMNMFGTILYWFIFFQVTLIGQLTCANILDVTCINFNPIYDTSSSASYAAILNGADVTSMVSFQRSVDLDAGDRQSTWCSLGDDEGACGLPSGSTIDSSGGVTFQNTDQDKFGVYGCRAIRYNWMTETSTIFIRNDAHFTPHYFTVTLSLDEEINLVMTAGSSSGTGSLEWILNHEDGGQTTMSSSVSGDALYISRAKKADHAGIHHYYYSSDPDRGGLVKLIVRACLDNLWGPGCQYTCPTCYNGGVCDDVSGRCVCPPGFSGDHCQIGCEAGKFGQGCSGSCTTLESGRTDCRGAVFCLSDPYGCSCAAGWTGLQCDIPCDDGSYGAGCTEICHCDSSASCDRLTGACSNGCEDGWTGDQCQVTVLDIVAFSSQGGVHDATDGTNFLGIFMIGARDVTGDVSVTYNIGREVDTGPGETGHGAYSKADGDVQTQEWEDTGLPPETQFIDSDQTAHRSLRALIDKASGGDARVGAYRMSVVYKGWTERTVLLNEYRGGCPSSKYGLECSQNCPVCYAGGVCHDVTGECVCRTGFQGVSCETACSDNNWGKSCSAFCSSGNPGCPNRLFSPPNPVGMACMNGFGGNRCQTECSGENFGANCELDCNCVGGTCDRVNGCGGQCSDSYEGNFCQALISDLPCPSGYFGTLCSYPCHCAGGVDCQRTNGHCPNGVTCAEGWAGSDCQQALPRLLESPWVSDVTKDSVLLIWNAWTDGYDYGNGPVLSYQIDYTWTDDKGNTGDSEVPLIITGDSTAQITGLFGFRDYDFYVIVRREVEGQNVAGVRSGPISAKTDCGAPLLEPEILSTTVNGIDNITVEWKIPDTPSSSWLQCDSSIFNYNLTYWPLEDPTNSTTIPVYSTEDNVFKTIDELDVCTEYEISIVVVNSIDLAGPADQTTAMTEKLPPQPVDSADVTADSYNHLEITWSESFSQCGAPSYNVSRRLVLIDQCDDSMADMVTWEVIDDTSIEYDDLLPYSTYDFTVLATLEGYDAETVYVIAYNSTESNSTGPPEYFTVDSTVKGQLEYTWSSPPCGDRNGALRYDYEFGEAGGDDVQRGTLIMTSQSFEDLKHYVMYDFSVCPRTVVGPGPCIFNQTRTLPSEPTRPLNIVSEVESTNQTYTIITWEKPELFNGLFFRYEIQKDDDNIIMISEEEERRYSFSDLEPNKEYTIQVRAVSNGGNGAWDSVVVTTLPIPEPNTPEVLNTTAKNDTSISIEWPLVDDTNLGIYRITHYTVSYSSGPEDENTIDVTYITSPMACTIAPLEPETEYYIKVRAVNEGGPGGWSESLTESTDPKSTTGSSPLAVGLGVGVPILLIIMISSGFIVYKKRRDAPPTPPKEYDLENVPADENGGTSNPVLVSTTIAGTPKAKPPVKQRPPQHEPIHISNLAKVIKAKRMSRDGFEKEYKALLNRSDEGCIGNNPENKPKNRYKNIITYDEHRVKLNKLPTEPGADYINATFIDGYKKGNAFIASQGPNAASLNDFWQMVYEQRTATIVMLTNLLEKDKKKCIEYWPTAGNPKRYGELEVITRKVQDEGSYVLRKFEVGKPDRTPHLVSQYHYTIWPDMGVPESSQPLLDFRDIVKNSNPADAGPIIVHCSAGVGRTGTFITIDCMIEMIEAEKKMDVFNFINEMRKRRAFMVQVQQQYEFIYETLLQWANCEKVSFSIIDLPTTVKTWRTSKDADGRTEMSRQFEVLECIAPMESTGSDQKGSLSENAKKNRYPDRVPVDKFKPLLMTKGDDVDDNDYINASFFDVEGRKNVHVCTQCPLMSTVGDFWRLVWDYDIHKIIHLNEMDSTCGQYWPDSDKTNFGSFTIELLSDRKLTDTMIERVLKVTTSKKKGERQITQLQYLGWPNDSLVPSSTMDFFELLTQVDNNNTSEKKFLVVCMDGVGASPTFLAADAAIDRVREDKTVDIFSAVKRLRKSRPGVVDELERYEFCYDVLAAYQDSVQTYANYM